MEKSITGYDDWLSFGAAHDFFTTNNRIKSLGTIKKEGLSLDEYLFFLKRLDGLTSFAKNIKTSERKKLIQLNINKHDYFCEVCRKPRKIHKHKLRVESTCGSRDKEHLSYIERNRLSKSSSSNKDRTSIENNISLIKRKNTNILKWGIEWPQKLQDVKEKTIKTMMIKYGVSNSSKLISSKYKIKKTSMARYGANHYSQRNLNTSNYSRLSQSTIKKYFIDSDNHLDVKKLTKFIGWATQTSAYQYCNSMGITWCHKQGSFNPNKPAILYYIKHNNLYKIGITNNDVKTRFGHMYKEIQVIKTWNYDLGQDALEAEQEILEAFSHYQEINEAFELVGGKTEFFNTDILKLDKGNL